MFGFRSLIGRASTFVATAAVVAATLATGSGVAVAATRQTAPAPAASGALSSVALTSPFISAAAAEAPASASWNVSLVADNTDITEGQTATLTAFATQPLDGTGYEILIYGFSESFGVPHLMTTCDRGSSCSVTVDWSADPVNYQAFIAAPGSFDDVQTNNLALSDTVTIPSAGGSDGGGGPLPWSVSLEVSPALLPIGKSVTVVAAANQTVAGTPYEVQIFQLETGLQVGVCGQSNGCTFTVPWNPNTQTFEAFVAEPTQFVPSTPAAQSEPVTVTGLNWRVGLGSGGANGMTAYAMANRAVGPGSSTKLMIWDSNGRKVLATCGFGTSCQAVVPQEGDLVFAFVVPDDRTSPLGVYLARSTPLTFPPNLYGSNNPSQNSDGTPCTCDPINPADGSVHETYNDITVSGRGPGLALIRSYDSTAASVAGRLGFGWSDGYNMQLTPGIDVNGSLASSLSTATTINVVQENGTVVPFTQQGDGSFVAAAGVLASLVHNADGSYTFTRRKTSVFTFGAFGTLTKAADLHGNTTTFGYDAFGRLSTVTDAAGRTLTYSYNDDGQVAGVNGPGGRSEIYGYDTNGNLVSAADESGATWRYGYDDAHELTTITDPDGRTTTNSYDGAGQVTAQTDGRGTTTSFTYNDDGTRVITHPAGDITTLTYTQGLLTKRTEGEGADARTWSYLYDPNTFGLAQVTDPDGHVTRYSYDADGNLTSTTDANGHPSSATFNVLGSPTRVTDANGAVTTMTYDAAGDVLTKKDPTGAVTSYTYNGRGEPTSSTDADGHTSSMIYDDAGNMTSVTDPVGAVTSMTFDDLGQVTSSVDPLGHSTSYAYDARGLRTSVTDPAGAKTAYSYDAAGQLTSMTDPTGRTWTYVYDGAGNLIRTTNPDGTFTTTTYDADGRKSAVSDAEGNTTTFAYDATGQLISTTDPTGATTKYAYDAAGLLTSTTSARGGVTRYTYDPAGQTTAVTDAAGGVSQYSYDPAGRTTTTTDPAGAITSYGYDADGRLTSTTDANGAVDRTVFDAAGLQLSSTDANGQLTSYSYDSGGRRISSTDPDGHISEFAYNIGSQLVTTTDAAGRVTTDSYDPAGRLVKVAHSDASTPNVSYSFDAAGRRLSMTDGTGTTTYSYDAAGRLASVTDGAGQVVGYGYDALGHIDAITYPDGRVVTQTYDAAGRLATTNDGSGNTTSYAYDGDGNLVATTYPNGLVQQQVYDPADRMTSTTVNAGSSTLASFAYGLSSTGLATSVSAGGSAGVTPGSQSYTYDPLSRLTSVATSTSGVSTAPTGSFHYDAVGNVTGLPDGTDLSYDAASQLTRSVGPGSISTTYGFDDTGDRTAATTGGLTSSYTYDQAGELTHVAIPARSPYGLMAGGWFFSLAIRGDGSVRAWGDNSTGELGDGGACGTTCPNQITVPRLPTIVQLAAGTFHALAVSTDGHVFAWGAGDRGQLGNGADASSSTPFQVKGLSDVVMVAAAGDTSYALTRDGRVFAWGAGDAGQLGNGQTADSATPVQVQGLPDIVNIAANAIPGESGHALAVSADGHVYEWGNNDKHPDVDTTDTGSDSGTGSPSCPTKTDQGKGNSGVPGNGGNKGGASGCTTNTDNGGGNDGTPGNGKGHNKNSVVIGSAASGSDRGVGNGGVPGNGHHDAVALPALVSGIDDVVQVAAGGWSSYALRADGTAWSWGDDSYGELGLGDPPNVKDVDVPTQIVGLPALKMLAAGGVHAVALTARGQVFAWGDDNAGQVGQPGPDCREAGKVCPTPQLVDGVTADAVAAGYVHTLISSVQQNVFGLGRDAEGELGDGYTHPATQVSAAGDRNGQDAPAGGDGGAKFGLTSVAGLAQVRPQAPVIATYTYAGDGLRATASTTVDDTTTTVPITTTSRFAWDSTTAVPSLLSDGAHDYISGPAGVIEQADTLGGANSGGTVFLHPDRLGSTRLVSDGAGLVVATFDYTPTGVRTQADGLGLLPYAQGIPPLQVTAPFGFAGGYTDPGTGSLYLQHRYDDPATDQFLSLDPALALTGQPYAYAGDDPINLVDLAGLGPSINPFSSNFWTKGNVFSDPVQQKMACGNSAWDSFVMSYDPVYQGMQTYSAARAQGNSGWDSAVIAFDPAYQGIQGYSNEITAARQGLPISTQLKYGAQGVAGLAGTVAIGTGAAGAFGDLTSIGAAEDGGGILANQAAGNAARDSIASQYPGSLTEQTFQTALGARRVDVLTQDGLAIESKVGRTSLTSSIQSQIAKDQWLLQNGDVNGVQWVFTRSGVTGQIGPTGPLQAALDKAGITWTLGP